MADPLPLPFLMAFPYRCNDWIDVYPILDLSKFDLTSCVNFYHMCISLSFIHKVHYIHYITLKKVLLTLLRFEIFISGLYIF